MTAAPLLGVPLIGGMAAGFLGIRGLPRLWQKALLSNAGALAGGCAYPDARERRMLAGIGVEFGELSAFLAYVPTYLETETWIRERSPNAVWEDADAPSVRDENLRDLAALHAYALAGRGARDVPLAPAASPLLAGELGLLHLPRLWAKATVDRIGLLPEGYNSGRGPLDEQLASVAGFDLAEAMRYVHEDRPSHTAFEKWISGHAATLDAPARAAWNERISGSLKPEHVAASERELLGIADPNERGGVLLNHLVDLHYFRLEVMAA
jgi:hypothetical protein